MSVAIKEYCKQWILVGEIMSTPIINFVNCPQMIYLDFGWTGYNFAIANTETGESFNFVAGDNFEFTEHPFFEYNKTTKQLKQCEPVTNSIL